MRLTIIEPYDSCREMRSSIEAMLATMQLEAQVISCQNERQSLSQAIIAAFSEAQLVLVVGGMSHGGFAREAAADALGRPLVHSKAAAGYIEQRCREQDLVFSEFVHCCNLPQGARSFAGDGLFPACLCVQAEHALLLFDEYDDPAQLNRLKSLLSTLIESPDEAPRASIKQQQPAYATGYPTEKAPAGKSKCKAHKAKKPSRPARSQNKSGRKKAIVGCIAISCVLVVMALVGAAAALLGASRDEIPTQQASASVVSSEELTVLGPVQEVPLWRMKTSSSEEDTSSSQTGTSSSESKASSAPPTSSSKPTASSSQSEAASSKPAATSSSAPVLSSTPAVASSSAPAVSSSAPPASSSAPPASSSSSEDESVYVYEGDDDKEEDDKPRGSGDTPSAHEDAFDEKLSYTSGGTVRRMNAYDLVCQVLQNETHGNLAPEALKAHAVATYSMIKYNNAAGIAPAMLLNSNISSNVEDAVDAVLGLAVYYNGHYANTVYHSTSGGYTTSSQAVWGGALPYLVSVKSEYDRKAPYYQSSYTISEDDFAAKVKKVYGITLDGDPEDWIHAERDAPGGYVGTVEIGGETRAQGGTYGTNIITGRSVRERLLSFSLRSHCFDVKYNASKERFEFTVYGYGHGVGMSQYGAHFMALEGYDYVEILEHYYTGTEIY